LFWTAFATAVAVLAFDLLDARHYYRDVDDVLRAVQIRQLLAHGSWFDLTISGIDMPGPYLSPWSRLVDLPYVLLTLVLRTVTSEANAIWWAFRIWQPLLLLMFCVLWVSTAARLSGSDRVVEPLHVVAAFSMMPLTLWEFSPGRIDHHNVQIVVLMLALFGISRWSAIGGFLAGVACGLSFVIGLELAPVLLILLVGPGLAWIGGVAGSQRVQIFVSVGLAVTTLLAGFFLLGPTRLFATECDAFSAPFVTAFLGYALITVVVVATIRSPNAYLRFTALALPAVGLVVALAVFYPDCLRGPYHGIDPLVRSLWLERVQQEKSFLDFYRVGELIKIVCLGLPVVVAIGALPRLLQRWRQGDAAFVIVFAVAVLLVILTFLQTRFIRFPAAFVMLFLPLVWGEVKLGLRTTRIMVLSGAAVTLLGGAILTKVQPFEPFRPNLLDYLALDLCTDIDASPFASNSPGRIVAPSSLGLFLLDRLPPGMTVNSIPFHRAAPGMRRMYDVFTSTESETRRAAAEPFDYLAVCRYPMVAEIPNDTMFAVLTRGGDWPGLIPIFDSASSALRLFKIDHARLQ
jgi:hypothetical protein